MTVKFDDCYFGFSDFVCFIFVNRQMTGISVTGLPYMKPEADAGNTNKFHHL